MKRIAITALIVLCATVMSAQAAGNSSDDQANGNVVTVNMGPFSFVWTFNKKVESGRFIDGQPWVVWQERLAITDVSPTGRKADNLYEYKEPVDGHWIDMTVRNPAVVTTIEPHEGKYRYKDNPVYAYDSRRLTRSPHATESLFDLDRAWYPGKSGEATLMLEPGDSIVTVKSFGPGEKFTNSPLKAAAVLTVLGSKPPADAFRPAVIRSGEQRTNPTIYTASQMVDLSDNSPHLIKLPTRTLYNKPYTPTERDWNNWSESRLGALLTGPELVSVGEIRHEGSHAHYNHNTNLKAANTYAGDMAVIWGNVAIGSLAEWLDESTRKKCATKMIQQAIDVYYAVDAGLTLAHDGGMNTAFGALITTAGGLLGDSGDTFLAVNDKVRSLSPDYYFADYTQCLIVSDKKVKNGATQYVDYRDPKAHMNLSTDAETIPHAEMAGSKPGECFLRIPKSYKWKHGRPHLSLLLAKLKINAGPGMSAQVYVVTGLKNAYKANGEPNTYSGTMTLFGGDLQVSPDWPKGNPPDQTSEFTISYLSSKEIDRIVFDSEGWGGNQYGELIRSTENWTASPRRDYASINAAAYLGCSIAIHALNVDKQYTSLFDDWLIQESQILGSGEVLFNEGRMHYMTQFGADTSKTRPAGTFLGALFRQEMLVPNGFRSIRFNPDTPTGDVRDYTVPQGTKLWNESLDQAQNRKHKETES